MSSSQSTASIEELYVKEKKKSQLLMLSTAVFAILFAGALVIGGGSDETAAANRTLADGQNQLADEQAGQFGAAGRVRGGFGVANFFSEDGSLNQESVTDFQERAAQGAGLAGTSQFADRFVQQIEASVASGDITQDQATQLIDALGVSDSTEL